MRKINITKRDIKFFFLGVLTIFIIDLVFNWQENKKAFIEGYNSTQTEKIK